MISDEFFPLGIVPKFLPSRGTLFISVIRRISFDEHSFDFNVFGIMCVPMVSGMMVTGMIVIMTITMTI